MNKELIRKRFSKSLSTYQKNAVVQEKMAKKLVRLIPESYYENILELGCGTGFLTSQINSRIKFKNYYAVDMVNNCSKYITKINPEIKFFCDDIEKLEFETKFDLIISNAALQWLEDFESYIKNLSRLLKPEGRIIFSTFGANHFTELSKVTDLSLKYYPTESLRAVFSDYKIEYLFEENRILFFKTPKQILEHLKKTGVNSLNERPWSIKDVKTFETNYKSIYNTVKLTYNPIYVSLKK